MGAGLPPFQPSYATAFMMSFFITMFCGHSIGLTVPFLIESVFTVIEDEKGSTAFVMIWMCKLVIVDGPHMVFLEILKDTKVKNIL